MRLAHEAWVLVLDGERVLRHGETENPPTREQGTDRPGRFEDPGPGRSAVEQTDWHALEKARFVAEMAERLRRWALDKRFEALVVVADPRTLGELRPAYHKTVAERVVAELPKDLTPMPVYEIESVLKTA